MKKTAIHITKANVTQRELAFLNNMETALGWQISKTILFIFNCFWCVPDFDYSDRRIMEKLFLIPPPPCLNHTSTPHTPNYYFSTLTPDLLNKIKDSNSSFYFIFFSGE